MAEIVLGVGTSHSPMFVVPPELWSEFALRDRDNEALIYPPDGFVRTYDEAIATIDPAIKKRVGDRETHQRQHARCVAALDDLSNTLLAAAPDVTVIVTDDQDEWLFESNMPVFSIYWGDSAPVVPRTAGVAAGSPLSPYLNLDYGDIELDVPVAVDLGRHVIESLIEDDFDVAHSCYLDHTYGGSVVRRYPTSDGERDVVKQTQPRRQGLPHGHSFVVKRLFGNRPSPILPIAQNTCYPPNAVTPRRAHAFGVALAKALAQWPVDARVAVVASGGLSHFVVDEELDRQLLDALAANDDAKLRALPQARLRSAASECLNWVTLGGVIRDSDLQMRLVDYVPVYRSEAGTGGGWAFAIWQ